MPCLAIHLAVAKEYLNKHPEENEQEFILGTIAPDIEIVNIEKHIKGAASDKNSRHFGENYEITNAMEYIKKKVNIRKFLDNNHLNTSFSRAYFLHLICDKLFFKEYVNYKNIECMSKEDIITKGYADYNRITPIIVKKYDLEVPELIKEIISGHSDGELELINKDGVYKFIEEMASLDILSFKDDIIKSNERKQ